MSVFKVKKAMRVTNKDVQKLHAETGISLSTLYRFLAGKDTYYSTQKLLELWAERQLRK